MKEEEAKLVVRVQPNASRNKITGFKEGVLSLTITPPPLRGKANQELIKYLSDMLCVPKSQIIIRKGATAKRKMISISDSSQERIMETISQRLEQEQT
ncbi:DUF167 domain-containing protein [Chloroflexota bacterium]